jgi:hypothetical protein
MRFVAKYQKYAIQARPQREIVTIDGVPMVAQEQIILEFEQGSLRPYEVDAGIAQLGARRGLPEGLDPSYRLSVFDTEWAAKALGFDNDTITYVEKFLLDSPSFGVDYILCEEPKVPAPWPNYDKLVNVEKLVAKVVDDGHDIDSVIEYEQQNKNRADVIAAPPGGAGDGACRGGDPCVTRFGSGAATTAPSAGCRLTTQGSTASSCSAAGTTRHAPGAARRSPTGVCT